MKPRAGGVAVEHGDEVGADRLDDGGLASEHFEIGLADDVAGHLLPVEPVGQTLDDGVLEAVLVEDGAEHETRDFGLAADDFLSFDADLREHRIDIAEPDDLG